MRFELHPGARVDIRRIVEYYEDVAGPELADEFYAELRTFIQKAAASPEGYAVRERDIRRVNLERFPFHFLFRIVEDRVRILVVRHSQPTAVTWATPTLSCLTFSKLDQRRSSEHLLMTHHCPSFLSWAVRWLSKLACAAELISA